MASLQMVNAGMQVLLSAMMEVQWKDMSCWNHEASGLWPLRHSLYILYLSSPILDVAVQVTIVCTATGLGPRGGVIAAKHQ